MPWRPLPQIAFAICTYPFAPSSPADLPLQIGDELYIIEQGGKNGAWYRGYLVAPPSLLAGLTASKGQALEARVFSGIFPGECVEIRELLGNIAQSSRNDHLGVQNRLEPKDKEPTKSRRHSSVASSGLIQLSAQVREPPTTIVGPKKQKESKTRPTSLDNGASVSRFYMEDTSRQSIPELFVDGFDRNSTERNASQKIHSSIPNSNRHSEALTRRPPAPVPMLKIGDESASAKLEPLIDEIASCLREWHSTNLHELLLNREYALVNDMLDLVARLDSSRRQLLHQVLTQKELDRLREMTVWNLVNGNKRLSGEVIVRSALAKGRLLTCSDSAVEISRLQSMMSLLNEHPTAPAEPKRLYHLLVGLKTQDINISKSATFTVCLYMASKTEHLAVMTEAYAIDVLPRDFNAPPRTDDNAKTLFTDLSFPELDDLDGNQPLIYLVIKVITNEPVENVTRHIRETPPTRDLNISRSHTDAKANGRKFSLKETKRSVTKEQRLEARPQSDKARVLSEKDQRVAKRTIAAGIIELNDLIKDQADAECHVTLWSPALIEAPGKQDNHGDWNSLIRDIIPSESDRYVKSTMLDHVVVHIRPFAGLDAAALVQSTPTSLHNIHVTEKIGLTGTPFRNKNDIYLTLSQLSLSQNVLLSHPESRTVSIPDEVTMANLQLTLEVRNASGERIENCIYPSSNSIGHTAWRSTAVERGGAWNQTIRLGISPQEVPGSHIVMSIADAPTFPFALCWMPLWTHETFISDGDHSLVLYKYDEYTSNMKGGKGAYLGLPWSFDAKDHTRTDQLAAITVRTFLSSTHYSQDSNLLGLLKWREHHSAEIVASLRRFMFVPEIEVVKLLTEVFNALFEILVEYAGNDELEDLTFNAVITVLGILHDRRFNLLPLVDEYAKSKFKYPLTFQCLVRSYLRLLSDPANSESSRKLRATFKVGAHILKFIVVARQQHRVNEIGAGIRSRRSTFMKDFQPIFHAIEALMLNTAPNLIGTKTIAVQYFHTWLPEFSDIMTSSEIIGIATRFIDSCSETHGKLVLYKLVLINHLSGSNTLFSPESSRAWHKNSVQWLAPLWGKTSSPTQQWRDQIRLCCSVVATQLHNATLEKGNWTRQLVDSYNYARCSQGSESEGFSLLFPATYPFPSRQTTSADSFDETLIEIAAVLADISRIPSVLTPDLVEEELASFLIDVFKVYNSIVDCDAFSASWLTLLVHQHKSILDALDIFSGFLIRQFLPSPEDAEHFNTELWKAFFSTLLKVVGSDALALEAFPEQKRRAVWKIGGDLRELGADILQRTWTAIGWESNEQDRQRYVIGKMGGYQVQYVPVLVGQILQLCLSVHEGLRSVATMVLQTMIVSEWVLGQDLAVIQAEIISCLDRLFRERRLVDGIIQKSFLAELIYQFERLIGNRDKPLLIAVQNMIGTVNELLDLLVAVHNPIMASEAFQIVDTLRLMNFLRGMHKDDMYVGYIYKLAQIQASANNFTEAGLALKMHADAHTWDTIQLMDAVSEPPFPSQTSFERKEQIYFYMIKHFEDGKAWHNALDAYRELAVQYEQTIFDFAKLARTQRAMATIYEKINKGDRQNPRYFRVLYRGLGFPSSLRDKHFIFEGSSTDRLTTFIEKMQHRHPSAQILTSGSVSELEGQSLFVYPVNPQRDLLHAINRRPNIAQSVKDHYVLGRPNQFTATARRQASKEAQGEVLERVIFTTTEAFPTILQHSDIISTEHVPLSPIRIGLERTIRKTQELLALHSRVVEAGQPAHELLTAGLKILVSPGSNGSVAQYWELLPKLKPLENRAEIYPALETSTEALEEALRVALMDHVFAIRLCLASYTSSAQQRTKEALSKSFEESFAPVITAVHALLHLPDEPTIVPWLLNNTLSPSILDEGRPAIPHHSHDKEETSAGVLEHQRAGSSTVKLTRQSWVDSVHGKSHTDQSSGATINPGNLSETRGQDDKQVTTSYASASNDLSSLNRQSSSQSIRMRAVGSVAKRFSSLSMGRKEGRSTGSMERSDG